MFPRRALEKTFSSGIRRCSALYKSTEVSDERPANYASASCEDVIWYDCVALVLCLQLNVEAGKCFHVVTSRMAVFFFEASAKNLKYLTRTLKLEELNSSETSSNNVLVA